MWVVSCEHENTCNAAARRPVLDLGIAINVSKDARRESSEGGGRRDRGAREGLPSLALVPL